LEIFDDQCIPQCPFYTAGFAVYITLGMALPRYLYRGENVELYAFNEGRLVPKKIGASFRQYIHYDGKATYGAGNTYGDSIANGVIQHQLDSGRNPTSGISSTPHFERARRYATWKHSSGLVFKIDTSLFERYAVSAHAVAEYAIVPKSPDDDEIILVARDFGPLPMEVVIEVLSVEACHV
jgi:hypothetical protein